MSVPARPKPKPDSAMETARVLRVFDMLYEELSRRAPLSESVNSWIGPRDILAIANLIAARTEDPS